MADQDDLNPSQEAEAVTPVEAEMRAQLEAAAKAVDIVVLPVACINEGKGAPLGMGLQRWWAQEISNAEGKAASPVFTAMAEKEGEQVPALMIYRDKWEDERALQGIERFANASKAVLAELHVDDETVVLTVRLVQVEGKALENKKEWEFKAKPAELPKALYELTAEMAAHCGLKLEEENWNDHFGTENEQAVLSFLVGLGNLSALQGNCVPASSEQLLTPLMDAINRDPEMDPAMDALHNMSDALLNAQPDEQSIPLVVQALNVAAQRRKDDPQAWHHLALVARQLGDLPAALNAFNQAFNLDPKDAALALAFIRTLRRADDSENALKVTQFAIERGNEHPAILGELGSLFIEADEHDNAEPFLRRAVEEGKVASAYGDLANVLWDRSEEGSEEVKEDRAEALKLLEQAVELDGVAKSTLDMLLDLHEDEHLEQATTLLLKCAEKFPEDPAVRTSVANMYLEGDNPEKARPHLQAILDSQNRSLDDDAFARRHLLSLDIEGFDEQYDQAVEQAQSDSAEQQQAAAKFFRSIIAKDQNFWQPHLMLALAIRSGEGDSAALSHLLNAVRLRPNEAEVHDLIAALLRKQGESRRAVEHLRAVVSLKPREIQPVVNLAACLRDANEFDDARQVCEAALQLAPDHPEFKQILDSLPESSH